MVGVLELVLDDHLASGAGFLRIDVDVERAHRRLGLYKLELNADCGAQYGKVGLLGEPLGEVKRLVWPYVAQIDLLQLIEVVFHRDPHRITINQYFALESKRPTRYRYSSASPIAHCEGFSRMDPF